MIAPRWVAGLVAASLLVATTAEAERRKSRRQRAREQAMAERMLRRGIAYFLQAEYRLAAQQLMSSYRLDRRDETLFHWAESVRANDDCQLAVRLYDLLGATSNDMELISRAAEGVEACDQPAIGGMADADSVEEPAAAPVLDDMLTDRDTGLDAGSAAGSAADFDEAPAPARDEDDEVTAAPEVPRADRRVRPRTEPARRRADAAVVLLGTSGTLLAAAGLVTYIAAAPGSTEGRNHGEITAAESRADWKRVIGTGLAAAGVGLSVTALLRYRATRDDDSRPSRVLVGPDVSPAYAGVNVTGRF